MSFRPKPWYFERDCPFCTQSASSFCRMWRPRLNRTLIIHANVYDQAQGLTGKHHSTTLNSNINLNLHILQTRGTEARIHSHTHKWYLSTDTVSQRCHKMAKTHNDKRSKEVRPPAWEPPKLLLVGWLDPVVSTIGTLLVVSTGGGIWLLGSIGIWCIIDLAWGKRIAKQPWVLIQSTRKTYIRSMLNTHCCQRNGAISLDGVAEMPE